MSGSGVFSCAVLLAIGLASLVNAQTSKLSPGEQSCLQQAVPAIVDVPITPTLEEFHERALEMSKGQDSFDMINFDELPQEIHRECIIYTTVMDTILSYFKCQQDDQSAKNVFFKLISLDDDFQEQNPEFGQYMSLFVACDAYIARQQIIPADDE